MGADNSSENTENSSFWNKKISRRDMAKIVAGGVVEGAVVGAARNPILRLADSVFSRFKSEHSSPDPDLKIEPVEFAPVPETDIKWIYPPGHEGEEDVSIRVAINSEGLPVKYALPDGTEKPFNLNVVKTVRERAMSTYEPEILDVFEISSGSNKYKYKYETDHKDYKNEQHPLLEKLPDDVLTEDGLKDHGLEIIQGNETQIYIRRGAFEKDGPLEAFANGDRKMRIVLIDGPVVSEDLLEDKKYDTVRKLLRDKSKDLDTFRTQKINEAYRAIDVYVDDLRKIKAGQPAQLGEEWDTSHIVQYKSLLEQYQSGIISDSQLYLERALEDGKTSDTLGLYCAPDDQGSATIFLAVGDSRFDRDVVTFAFKQTGEFSFTQIPGYFRNERAFGSGNRNFSPKPEQSALNPDDFPLNLDASPDKPKSYPYAGLNTGFALEHEAAHDKLMTGVNPPNTSEYDTDMLAAVRLRRAWNKWKDSGFKDNSGYSFVFKLPQGGYILTKSKEQLNSSSEKEQA